MLDTTGSFCNSIIVRKSKISSYRKKNIRKADEEEDF